VSSMPQGVPLFDDYPGHCPYGHPLRGHGTVTRGWMPCGCSEVARAREKRRQGWGHLWIKCRGCEAEGRRTFYYEPPHVAE
jgi:hypothetical protein